MEIELIDKTDGAAESLLKRDVDVNAIDGDIVQMFMHHTMGRFIIMAFVKFGQHAFFTVPVTTLVTLYNVDSLYWDRWGPIYKADSLVGHETETDLLFPDLLRFTITDESEHYGKFIINLGALGHQGEFVRLMGFSMHENLMNEIKEKSLFKVSRRFCTV